MDLGWEIDFGISFNIVENVWLQTEFGYFFNVNAFEEWNSVTNTWDDPKDTFAWATVLRVLSSPDLEAFLLSFFNVIPDSVTLGRRFFVSIHFVLPVT
jgi:hypothetical protein